MAALECADGAPGPGQVRIAETESRFAVAITDAHRSYQPQCLEIGDVVLDPLVAGEPGLDAGGTDLGRTR